MRILVFLILAVCAVVALATAGMAANLTNGGMEDPYTNRATNMDVADPWQYVQSGFTNLLKSTTTVHTGASQYEKRTSGTSANYCSLYQTVDANIGDAFTFEGWVYAASANTKMDVQLRADWAGGTNRATASTISLQYGFTKIVWSKLGGPTYGGNATSTSVTLFLDNQGRAAADISAWWDDVVAYRAYVPAAAAVGNATTSSLKVDVDPGLNNANAQYAISVGGGAYAIGTNWLQSTGIVGTTPVWQTDAAWGNKTVWGLGTGTNYTFQAKARYDGTYTKDTYFGAEAYGATLPIPEPGSMIALLSGLVGLVGSGVRRRK
jgi:hypothetical protein